MRAWLRAGLRSRRREDGTVAIIVSGLCLALIGLAALSVDISSQVLERQKLRDTVDAAAHAAAGSLPTGEYGQTSDQVARAYASTNDAQVTLASGESGVRFWCLVGANGGQPVASQIPSTCDPGPGPYVAKPLGGYLGSHDGKIRCDAAICKIPCKPSEGDVCNTVEVLHEKPVDFSFGGALGTPTGSTGTISGAACKGPCGAVVPNPIDLAVVADRTGSMGGAIADLEIAVESLLEFLTPSQHRVALGTIGRSGPGAPAGCKSQPSGNRATGPWFPVGFSDDYDDTDVTPPSNPAVLSSTSTLALAADCLGNANSSTGTYLAAPMRAARELLTGTCVAALCAAPASPRPSPVKKAVMFMTDGEPNESSDPGHGYPFNANGTIACNNAVTEAATAKSAGVLVVTIAFRLEGVRCEGSTSPLVTGKLAEMASPKPDGTPSLDDGGGAGGGCDTPAKVSGENGDGDNFFCTPTPSELEPVFRIAASQLTGSTRLVKLPAD